MKYLFPVIAVWLSTLALFTAIIAFHEHRADARARVMAPPLVHINTR